VGDQNANLLTMCLDACYLCFLVS